MSGNLRDYSFTIPDDVNDIATLREVLNSRLREIGEAMEAQNGRRGKVKLGDDLDLNGHSIINLGKPKSFSSAVSLEHAETNYGFSAIQQLMQSGALDLTAVDVDGDFFDENIPDAVQNVTVRWKEKSGWKWRWNQPGNAVHIRGYWIWLFNDSAGVQYMHPDDGTSVATQALAERFVETTGFSTDISRSDLVAPFSAGGVKASIQCVARVKGLGRVRGRIYTDSALNAPGGDPTDDTGAASAVQSLALRWGAKKKGFKSTWQPPATNWTSSIRYFKVAYSDSAATNWMNPHDGTLAASEAAATIKVTDTHHTTHLERSELAAQFAAGVKVKITPVNTVAGVETDGTTATSSFVAPDGEDTGPPSAVQNLSLTWGAKKKGFKSTWDRPATNSLSIQGYKVAYSNSPTPPTNWMNPHTGALASPNTQVGATIFVHDDHHTTHLLRSQLASQFAAGVKVTVTAVNIVLGVETDGTPATSSFVAPDIEDTAAPSFSAAPKFKYKNGAFHCKQRKSDSSDIDEVVKVEMSINNGTNSLNLDDLDAEVFASGIVFYDLGKGWAKDTVPMSRDQVKLIFGTSASLVCAFKITNQIGVGTTSNSTALNSNTLKDMSRRTNPLQLLKNPGLVYASGADLRDWIDFNPNSNNEGTIQTAAGSLRWTTADANVWWRENTASAKRYLGQKLGKNLFAGDAYSYAFFLESNGSITMNFDAFLAVFFTATGTADPAASTTLTGTGTAFLTEIKVGDEITVNGETRTVQSITNDTTLVVTSAFTNTAGGATVYVVRPQSEIVPIGSTVFSAGVPIGFESVFTYNTNPDATRRKYIFFRPNGTIITAGPYIYFSRPVLSLGLTPAEFTLKTLFEDSTTVYTNDIDFPNEPTGGGGVGQESSGEPPDSGEYGVIL